MKSVQKEAFSQHHIINATCVMFFYAAMRRRTVSENSIICENHILSIDIIVSVFVDTVYGDITIKSKHNF